MGMDVYGKSPTTTEGEYFRANIWWWPPLAEYCTQRHPGLTAACTYWFSNDGDGLDAGAAAALAAALRADLDSGAVARYAREREEFIAALPREDCHLCQGTGARTDDIGRQNGLDSPGGCNGCRGTGKAEPMLAMYGFDEQTVKEFTQFLEGCGGFAIW